MNLIDWVLVGMVIACAWIGFRRGLVTSLLSFVGFIGGSALGALLLPDLVASLVHVAVARPVTLVIGIILSGFLGQFLARMVGRRLRASVRWQSARLVDSIGGAVVTVLALAVVVWIVSSAISALPTNPMTTQARSSRLLVLLDTAAPSQAREALARLRQVASGTSMPQLFAGVAELSGQDVGAPSSGAIDLRRLASLRPSIVDVHGNATACLRSSTGTGFVVGSGLVLTNAHVVAGVRNIGVRQGETTFRATLQLFDADQDVAVLQVAGLRAPALTLLARSPDIGVDVAAVGYPDSGPLTAIPLRVRGSIEATGDDLYGTSSVRRSLIAVQGPPLRPGISGSPVVDARGNAVAMVLGASTATRDVAYAIPGFVLRDAVQRAQAEGSPIPQTACVD